MSSQPPPAPAPAQPPVVIPAAPQKDLTLEIHHLDVHGGDATAIVVKNRADSKILYKALIDAGAEGSGSASLLTYLETFLKGTGSDGQAIDGRHFDCIIATHYHRDHIEAFVSEKIEFKHYLDNGGYAQGQETFTPVNGNGVPGLSQIYSNYTSRIFYSGAKRIKVPFIEKGFTGNAEPTSLELGAGTGIFLKCYCANGVLANGNNVLLKQKQQNNKKINPNDVSLAFVLEWEDFTYFTAGDLSGDPDKEHYYDIESELLKYLMDDQNGPLKGKTITVLKVSHHGSRHSNQTALFEKLQPECVIIPCNQPKKVPSPVFLDRLKNFLLNQQANKKTKRVLFTNSLHVFPKDDRYAPLDAMKAFIDKNNVEFKLENNQPSVVSNLGIKAVTIRRHSGGKKYQEQLGDDMLKIEVAKYDIFMRKRDANENSALQKTMRLKTYEVPIPFEVSYTKRRNDTPILLKDEIIKGFKRQADAIVSWIEKDDKTGESIGNDYVYENFPGLTSVIHEQKDLTKLSAALVTRMTQLFDGSYSCSQEKNLFEPKNIENKLKSDEKETFYYLIMNNRYQEVFNLAIKQVNHPESNPKQWIESGAWNATGEPYPAKTFAGYLRTRKLEVPDRKEEENKEDKAAKKPKLPPASAPPAPGPVKQ